MSFAGLPRVGHLSRRSLLLLAFLLPTAGPAVAAQPAPRPGETTSPNPGLPPERLVQQLVRVRGHRVLLERAREQLDAGRSDSGLRLLQAILDSPTDSFLVRDGRLLSARREALLLLRGHPVAGVARYAKRYEQAAAALLRQATGVGHVDRVRLRDVVRRHFLAPSGFLALDRLSTAWLDLGQFGLAARGFAKLIDEPAHRRRVSGPLRRKAALALALAGRPRPAADLRLPVDQRASVAAMVARGSLATADWPLPFGSAQHTASRPGSTVSLRPAWQITVVDEARGGALISWSQRRLRNPRSPSAVAFFPLVIDQQVIVRDDSGLRGIALASGATLWRYRSPLNFKQREAVFSRLLPVVRGGPDRAALVLGGNPRLGMITSDGQRVYAVVLSPDSAGGLRQSPEPAWPPRLVAIPLPDTAGPVSETRVVRPAWIYPPETANPATPASRRSLPIVLGPPLPLSGQLVVLVERERQIELVELSPADGRELWRQPLAACETALTEAVGAGRHTRACLPAEDLGLAICPAGPGITVSVDLVDGTLAWAHATAEGSARTAASRIRVFSSRRGTPRRLYGDPGLPNLPLVTAGRVLLLSATSPQLACLDSQTGRVAWSRPRGEIDYLAAAGPATLLVVGRTSVRGLDLQTGERRWQRRLGLSSGRGARLDGNRYLVPLKSGRVACLEIATGRAVGFSLPPLRTHAAGGTRPANLNPAADPRPLGLAAGGRLQLGNLLVTDRWVLSLDARNLTAFPQAATELARVQRELAGLPASDRLRLDAAELSLTLGRHEQAVSLLEPLVSAADPAVGSRARAVLSELLYLQLDRSPRDAGPLLDRLEQLAETPRQQARLLVEQTDWHLRQNNAPLALAAISRLEQLAGTASPPAELSADRDGIRILARTTWVANATRRALSLTTTGNRPADRALMGRLAAKASRLVGKGILPKQLAFVARHLGAPLADPVRMAAADKLVAVGQFQHAELLYLQVRRQGGAAAKTESTLRLRVDATVALVRLWDRLGLYEEASILLDELDHGPLAGVADSHGRRGREWVAGWPADSLALASWHRHRRRPVRLGEVSLHLDNSVASSAELSDAYQRYRRRFSTSERTTLDLLETYTGRTRRITMLDRQVGVASGHVDLPTQFTVPNWWHQVSSGHLLPLGGPSSVIGVSLLQRQTSRPLWQRPYQPLVSRPELLRVGPSGPSFCCFQSRRHLFATNPADGSLLWRRSDIESGSGLFADAAAGLFGDSKVLVVSSSDRIRHEIFETTTGRRLGSVRLPLLARTRRLVFGRLLMYVSTTARGQQRMRVWDPLGDRVIRDELLYGSCAPIATPGNELAWLDATGRLKVHDFLSDRTQLDIQVIEKNGARRAGPRGQVGAIKVFRDRDSWFIALLPHGGVIRWGRGPGRAATRNQVYFVGDTLLPVIHIHGELLAIDAATSRVRWRRPIPLRSALRFRHDRLPVLVLLGRTRDRGGAGQQRMLLELIDMQTGVSLLLKDNLPTDRIVQSWYDPEAGRLELRGLRSRIDLEFSAR